MPDEQGAKQDVEGDRRELSRQAADIESLVETLGKEAGQVAGDSADDEPDQQVHQVPAERLLGGSLVVEIHDLAKHCTLAGWFSHGSGEWDGACGGSR